ncbi:UNVERIFIED_CONTAM: hypothetical protein Slati_3539600 [Sesamum latifolium]|uniref:Reverse transcriptase domain-containing protein n=1 Tax=Sesamum latifolium TaxID=2727402 RepID=A0AAW2UL64_9LAMI
MYLDNIYNEHKAYSSSSSRAGSAQLAPCICCFKSGPSIFKLLKIKGYQYKGITGNFSYSRPWARHIISEDEAIELARKVTPNDVKQAVFDISEDKAPGPNGFSSGFFKAAWPVVGTEVTKVVLEFFATGKLLKQVNATLLSLIPKVWSPTMVGEFRPISCCNVLYKVITKIIVMRRSVVLDSLIRPSQNAFVSGRTISDNILLAQLLPPRCALKVDLRKAYDTVERDFLIAVLKLFGFPSLFILWIKECVTSLLYSVCLNGAAHGYFKGHEA